MIAFPSSRPWGGWIYSSKATSTPVGVGWLKIATKGDLLTYIGIVVLASAHRQYPGSAAAVRVPG
jgi:hypothetical protein